MTPGSTGLAGNTAIISGDQRPLRFGLVVDARRWLCSRGACPAAGCQEGSAEHGPATGTAQQWGHLRARLRVPNLSRNSSSRSGHHDDVSRLLAIGIPISITLTGEGAMRIFQPPREQGGLPGSCRSAQQQDPPALSGAVAIPAASRRQAAASDGGFPIHKDWGLRTGVLGQEQVSSRRRVAAQPIRPARQLG